MSYPSEPSLGDVTTNSTAILADCSQALDATRVGLDLALAYEDSYLRQVMIDVALLTMFFGLFTILAAVAAYILSVKDIKRRGAGVMLAAIIMMWASTATHCIATLLDASNIYLYLRDLTFQSLDQVRRIQHCLASLSDSAVTEATNCLGEISPTYRSQSVSNKFEHLTSCVDTVTLTVVLGDSIVWWRAWVLWPNSRIVHCICVVAILATMVTGAVDTWKVCENGNPSGIYVDSDGEANETLSALAGGTLFSGDLAGSFAVLCSLFTNVIATLLIAYRSWEHRRIIMSYLKMSSPRTQVERTLALLVESGVLYCVLWVFIVIYVWSDATAFKNVFFYVMSSCLIPLIAMYPTLVIIVCAVSKSLNESSLEEGGASVVFQVPLDSRRELGVPTELAETPAANIAQDSGKPGIPSDDTKDIMEAVKKTHPLTPALSSSTPPPGALLHGGE